MKMTANERKGLLLTKGYTLRRLGLEIGVSHALVSQVVNSRSRSRRVEAAIAEIIGQDVQAVFPPRTGTTESVGASALTP